MKLTEFDKKKIFWALIDKYPEYERARVQAEDMFKNNPEKLVEVLNYINKEEKYTYNLIKRFSDKIGINIPKMPTEQ